MAGSGQGNDGAEMNALKIMVGSLADAVGKLTAHKTAPDEQFKKSQAVTANLEYQARCLKRERECDANKKGVVRQQNLLDELLVKVKAATDAINRADVLVAKGFAADITKPIDVVKEKFVETDEGKEVLTALSVTSTLLEARLLDLSVVCAATATTTNAIRWSTVESLTGSTWRDYCTDDKHALVVKDALAEHEKRAVTASDRASKDADPKRDSGRKDEGKRRRPPYQSYDTGGSYNTVNGVYIPPPAGSPSVPNASSVMRPGPASGGLPARSGRPGVSFHDNNPWCYKCLGTDHRSGQCPNAPAPGRF